MTCVAFMAIWLRATALDNSTLTTDKAARAGWANTLHRPPTKEVAKMKGTYKWSVATNLSRTAAFTFRRAWVVMRTSRLGMRSATVPEKAANIVMASRAETMAPTRVGELVIWRTYQPATTQSICWLMEVRAVEAQMSLKSRCRKATHDRVICLKPPVGRGLFCVAMGAILSTVANSDVAGDWHKPLGPSRIGDPIVHTTLRGLSAALCISALLSGCSGGTPSPTATNAQDGATPGATAGPGLPAGGAAKTPTPAAYRPPSDRPGPAVDKLLFKAFTAERAALDLEAGNMDAYLFGLPPTAASSLRSTTGIRLMQAPSMKMDILLNPAPAPEGELNPFSIKGVRQAIQDLVNREFIASDVYQGQAEPMVAAIAQSESDYLTIFDQVKQADYSYDPEGGRARIQAEMTKAGATMIDGKWSFKGKPIRLKFVIRTEDERQAIGDAVRGELERAGFLVTAVRQDFAPATKAVYASDPKEFQWHLYTEGWSRTGAARYDASAIGMAAPWAGNMPGWQEAGFWQYEHPALDSLSKELYIGAFQDRVQRDALYREVTRIALDESVRVWVVTLLRGFPVSSTMQGITENPATGPKDLRTFRDAYIPGRTELTLGNLFVWTDRTTWNPVGGFSDAYSGDIVRYINDPPLDTHPFSGLPEAFRATYQVQTAGPKGKLPIPPDAMTWDAESDRWTPAKASQATSKVTLDYSQFFSAKWHHGQPITMADVLYSISQDFDITYGADKSQMEVALSATSRPTLDTVVGFRVLDSNRIEVYVDYWHFEESYIAAYATPSGLGTPWEVLAAMDDLVFNQRKAAYTDTAAGRFKVRWISLVQQNDVRLVRQTLEDLAAKGFVPGSMTLKGSSVVSPQDAQARYRAAIKWVDDHGLLVIGNGPFFLARFDPAAQFAELQAYRDPSYPFKAGSHYLGAAPRVEIRGIRDANVSVGKPADIAVQVSGKGALGLHWVLIDPASRMVVQTAEGGPPGADGVFHIKLDALTTRKLKPGLYRLSLAAYSDAIMSLAQRDVDLQVGA